MRQTLHIFAKDVRKQWMGIACALILLVLHGHYETQSWIYPGGRGSYASGVGALFLAGSLMPGLVEFLLLATWTILILRIVHDDALVGDRQFWVTRPYEWKSLLTAKLLFALAFIDVPLFGCQVYLLARAGFSPTGHLTGLFGMHGANWLLLVLPLMTLATMTGALAQTGLGVVVVVLYLVASSYSASLVLNSDFSGAGSSFEFLAFLAVCVAVILIQYARRAWWRSVTVLCALAITTFFLSLVWPYGSAIAREYPTITADQTPLTLSLKPAMEETEPHSQSATDSKEVFVHIPFYVAGIDEHSIINVRGWQVALDFPDGSKWDSGWRDAGNLLFSDRNEPTASFTLKRKLFERWRSSAITAKVSMAYEKFTEGERRDFVVPDGTFTLGETDSCVGHEFGGIECLAPIHGPSFLVVRSEIAKSTCEPPRDGSTQQWQRPEPGVMARGYQRSDTDLFQPGISPVFRYEIQLSEWKRADITFYPAGVCPGTPLVLSNPQLKYKAQTVQELRNFRLSDYVSPRIMGGAIRIMHH